MPLALQSANVSALLDHSIAIAHHGSRTSVYVPALILQLHVFDTAFPTGELRELNQRAWDREQGMKPTCPLEL